MKISPRLICYALSTPLIYALISIIMKGSVHDIDWKMVIIITIASIVGVTLGNIINKKFNSIN